MSGIQMKYLMVVLSLLSGCGASSSNSSEASLQLEQNFNLKDTFSQQSNNFLQGENIELFLVLTNHSANAVTLTFSSGQQYDFYIKSSIDAEVWRWSENKVFTLDTTELTLRAGESVEVSEIWNQEFSGSDMAAVGSYSAFGLFLGQPETLQFDFIIQ